MAVPPIVWLLVLSGLGRGKGSGPGTSGGGGPAQLPGKPTDGDEHPDRGTPLPDVTPPPRQPWNPPIDPGGRPNGNPFGRSCAEYNKGFWPTQVSIKERFSELGYPVPADRDTMNHLGTDGKLGGTGSAKDARSDTVAVFQEHYNMMSRRDLLGPDAGGLEVDGFVGGCTLNGIELVLSMMTGQEWAAAVMGTA